MDKNKSWKAQEKKSEHKNVRYLMCEMAKLDGFIIKPIRLIGVFKKYLQENHKSRMNSQQARNMAEVYSALCHMFFIAGEQKRFNKDAFPFFVSQSVWNKLGIKRSAIENSITLLKEMGLIDYYNACDKGKADRRKRRFVINRMRLEWLLDEAKSLNAVNDCELEFDDWGEFKGENKKFTYNANDYCAELEAWENIL